ETLWGASHPLTITAGQPLGMVQMGGGANIPGAWSYAWDTTFPPTHPVLIANVYDASQTPPAGGPYYIYSTFQPHLSDGAPNDHQYDVHYVGTTLVTYVPQVMVEPVKLSAGAALVPQGSANVPGTFSYSPAAGTLMNTPGEQTLTATFTPTDLTNNAVVVTMAPITVSGTGKTAPVITWSTPAAVTAGTALSATQLNATANVAGTFVYTPAAGTVTNTSGTQTLSVTFTPSDSTNYSTATATVALTVKAKTMTTPVLTWTAPAAITYGTALSATQLSATANVPGTFTYSPEAGTVLPAGSQRLNLTFTPTDAATYSTVTKLMGLTVNKVTPVVTWAAPAAVAAGTVLDATQLNATANVAGTFLYTPAAGTVMNTSGAQTLSVTFTPTDATDYNAVTKTVSLTVSGGKTNPTVSWAVPAAITAGTVLSATQLNATANVAGTFLYTPAAGTMMSTVGTQTLSVTFMPTDTTAYNTVTKSVSLTVKAKTITAPVVTWVAPAAIPYGTALSVMQLSATANVPGTFTYSPEAGTVLPAGSQRLNLTFTPDDPTSYSTVTKLMGLTVNKAVPVVTWAAPAAMTAGTALDATQLNATTNVDGTFIYTPAAGTVMNTSGAQTLSVTFTPTDTTDYSTVTKTVSVTVNGGKTDPVITWAVPAAITAGTALSATQLNATANVAGTISYMPAAGTVMSTVGAQTLSVTFTPADAATYNIAAKTVALTVKAKTVTTPVVTWVAPAAITYGTALSATQLSATSTVPGTFTYTPEAGTVMPAGSQRLNLTFTPNDPTSYTTVTKLMGLTVNKAAPVVTWAVPAAVTAGTALDRTQLNAAANVDGTFIYTPAAGTVLNTSGTQSLSVTFTPADTTDYSTVTKTVSLSVKAQ
ncbi:MAG: hypothetical protein FWD64_06025, partial [Acidobacteriaceae bacterium]|nr:hypothetical protein [Acidobacteriaceae bacterium]